MALSGATILPRSGPVGSSLLVGKTEKIASELLGVETITEILHVHAAIGID